jgi:chromodomain-helicase-DNA-binding protein 4
MLLVDTTSLVRGVNADYDDTLDTDGVNHLESADLASSQSLVALVGTQAVLSCMSPQKGTDLSAQQNLALSWCSHAEAEQTGMSGTQVVQVLQPEMQRSMLFSDAPPQKTHPDDRRQIGCEPNRITGLSQGGATISHHFGDVRMQVQEKYDGNVAADPVLPESPTYPADIPVILHVSTKVESQICGPSLPAEQSTCLPGQQRLPTSPAKAEPVGIVGTEATCSLQPEVQPSNSMLDEPEEVEDEPGVENESEAADEPAEAERAGTLGALASQDLRSEKQLLTSTQDVPFERTYLSGMPVLQSPTIHQIAEPSLDPHAGVEPVGMLTAHDLQSKIQPSALVSAEQNTSLPAQQSLATSQHPPALAKPADILDTEPACDLQPKVQPSTSVQDERAEADDEPEVPDIVDDEPEAEDEPAEAEQAPTLGAIPVQDLQPGMQSSTSTQVVPF